MSEALRQRLADDLDRSRDPALEADQREALAADFLAALAALERAGTAPPPELDVAPLVPGVVLVVVRLQERLGAPFEWGDEWEWICERRSELQFLLDRYGEPGEDDPLSGLKPPGLDAQLRERGRVEGGTAEPPPGTPESHWWWRCRPG